jgi:hypothetical protein
MKYLAAVALTLMMMTSTSAFANEPTLEQRTMVNTITIALLAEFTGNQKNNRCPRFRVIDKAVDDELAEAGLTLEMLHEMHGAGDFENDRVDDYMGTILADEYNKDPSAFCYKAWHELGPNGTYKRQMLEAK